MSTEIIAIAALTGVVSLLYSSVGHGGASGYLALLSFFSFSYLQMGTSALFLNLLVAGIAFWVFGKASFFKWNLTWPFILTSIPFAFLGGAFKVPRQYYAGLLLGILLFAAFRMLIDNKKEEDLSIKRPSIWIALPVGGGVGFLSGIIGVGGGIFLSPLLLMLRWATPKEVAATAAFFILVNSFSGLLGRYASDQFNLSPLLYAMPVAALAGAFFGSRLGAFYFTGKALRVLLASVLLVACVKLVFVMA